MALPFFPWLDIEVTPLAGGPSTPELTAAVADAGAFAFLGAGYLSVDALSARLSATRRLTGRSFGVNLFVPGEPTDPRIVAEYAARLGTEADRMGVSLGDPRFDDDGWDDKLALLLSDPVAVVSFTFGCPAAPVIDGLHRCGTEVWVTVTTLEEASAAEAAGVDVVVAQGVEAGGHRGTWRDDGATEEALSLFALVQLVRASSSIPIVATGGIATGSAVAGVLAAGANAAALGTAFLLCPEAGTSEVHRAALTGSAPTSLTRAFTGRTARGIRNRMMCTTPWHRPRIPRSTSSRRRCGRRDEMWETEMS